MGTVVVVGGRRNGMGFWRGIVGGAAGGGLVGGGDVGGTLFASLLFDRFVLKSGGEFGLGWVGRIGLEEVGVDLILSELKLTMTRLTR